MKAFVQYFTSTILLSAVLVQSSFAQIGPPDRLDIKEAEARGTAMKYISSAEERFECVIDERSMRKLGGEAGTQFLFLVNAKGDDCNSALVYLTKLAAREDKLLYRQVAQSVDSGTGPLTPPGQELIHEVNPGIEDSDKDKDK
jgi:hypothetical protein